MNTISLFAGAGGMDIGFDAAGFRITDAYELDPKASATLKANFPDCRVHVGDFHDHLDSLPAGTDLIIGGPPCQPFSAAGKGRGEYDPRDCFPLAIEAVRRLQPKAFVFENVRGLTFKKHRPYLDQVASDFAAVGYTGSWQVLDAADFGVPQHRHRLFIVGIRRDLQIKFQFPEPTHGKGRLPWVTVRQALGLGIEHRPNRDHGEGRPESSWNMDGRPSGPITATSNHYEVPVGPGEVANIRQTGRVGNRANLHEKALRDDLQDMGEDLVGDTRMNGGVFELDAPSKTLADGHSRGIVIRARRPDDPQRLDPKHPPMDPDAPASTIRSGGDGHTAPPQYLDHPPVGRGVAHPDEPSPAVLGAPDNVNDGGGRPPYLESGGEILDEPAPTIMAGEQRPTGMNIFSKGTRDRLYSALGEATGVSEEHRSVTNQHGRFVGGVRQNIPQSQRLLDPDAPATTIPSMGQGETGTHAPRVAADTNLPILDAPSTVIGTDPRMSVPGHHYPIKGASSQYTSQAGVRYRRLTWQECAALQAFPADYRWEGGVTTLYRQVGNAVPPPLAQAVATALFTQLAPPLERIAHRTRERLREIVTG